VESYLQALSYMPDDPDTRHNLEVALRAMQEQKNQQQNQSQDQRQNQQQGKGDQEQQGQRGEKQENQQQEEKNERQQPQQPDSTQATPQPSGEDSTMARPELPDSVRRPELSKEDALRLLKLLDEQEKELQKEKRKAAFIRVPRSGKDW